MSPPASLRRASFTDLAGWQDDDHLAAFHAFRRCGERNRQKPYRSGSFGVPIAALEPVFARALDAQFTSQGEARAFFESNFEPFAILPPQGEGLVTGYYEPVHEASPVETGAFRVPLLAVPDDLVELDDRNDLPEPLSRARFGRLNEDGEIVAYHDRRAVETGALGARARPLLWLRDPVDAFFIHVQGAARLAMADGTQRRVTYAAKSGHEFTGPGRVLVEMGEIPAADVSMQSIRAWLRAHPDRINEILWQNRSYIFFREVEPGDPDLGPVAAAKVQLSPGRSIAVDRLLHTFGTPFHISSERLLSFGGTPFCRLMIAQDTGSAIVGPARADLFAGTGDEAGEIAGVINHPARFHMLVPRVEAEPVP